MGLFKMHWNYAKYIFWHKLFVFRAGLVLKVSIWRLLIHDWSKLLPCEWFPYAEFFYGKKKSTEWFRLYSEYGAAELAPWGESVQDLFDEAWLHHIHYNKHHWNYFVLVREDGDSFALPMPEKYVREMVADWYGAGRAIIGKWNITEWWEKHRGTIKLHPITRKLAEDLIVQAAKKLLKGETL